MRHGSIYALVWASMAAFAVASPALDKVAGRVVRVHVEPGGTVHIGVQPDRGELLWLTAGERTRYVKSGNQAAITELRPGKRVTAVVVRDGKTLRVEELTWDADPLPAPRSSSEKERAPSGDRRAARPSPPPR